MAESVNAQQARLNRKIEEIQQQFGSGIRALLDEMNRARLKGKGKITASPVVDRNNLRWTLAWKDPDKVSFELNVVVQVEDDGRAARVGKVWVHRHASAPLEFEGHTPTTRMRRLTGLSLAEIREAIESEW